MSQGVQRVRERVTYKDATHKKGVECNEAKVLNRNTIGVGSLDKMQ